LPAVDIVHMRIVGNNDISRWDWCVVRFL